jgi:MFS family permease
VILTKAVFAAVSAGLALLTFTGSINVAWILGLMFLSALTNTVDNPTHRALVVGLIPRSLLPQAISFNLITFQLSCILGPTLAGLLMALRGPGWVYAIDAVSFLFVIAAFLVMDFRPPRAPATRPDLKAVKEGLRFLHKRPILWNLMLIDFVATFFSSLNYLIPVFAKDVLHVGEKGYGLLFSAISIGSLAGALTLGLVRIRRRHGARMLAAVAVFGLSIVGFGLSRNFALSFFCLALSGFCDMFSVVIRQSLTQLLTPDKLRGRMSAINMVFFAGGPQLGELKSGFLAGWIGAPAAAALGGGATVLLAAGYAAFAPWLRKYSLPPEGEGQEEGMNRGGC